MRGDEQVIAVRNAAVVARDIIMYKKLLEMVPRVVLPLPDPPSSPRPPTHKERWVVDASHRVLAHAMLPLLEP